jgi:mediator of RNA polymerase II transcription subunit 7
MCCLHVTRKFQHCPLPGADFKAELRRCNREILFGFIELLGALTERPSAYARQLEAVGIALRNQLHLCNLLLPHQVCGNPKP